ncbi:MAG: hypothetical protein LBD04_05305, partial [Synergistaceae bacterium]|nr:hypothetical protein [Synergistaceae bacterium]
WSAETAFNVIKNSFGLTQAWEQTKRTFARWRCILCLVYGICAMASFLRDRIWLAFSRFHGVKTIL